MTEAEARKMVVDALAALDLLEPGQADDAGGDVDLASLNIDSMKVIDLCMALEEGLGREVQVEELVENPSVNKLAKHFSRKKK